VKKTDYLLYGRRIQSAIFDDVVDENLIQKHTKNAKVVLLQAFLYIAAFLVGVFPPFLRLIVEGNNASDDYLQHLLEVTLFLLPLQGFFNFLIFISHKVYNYRRINTTESIYGVIRLLFVSSTHEPCFISRISVLWNHIDSSDDEKKDIIEVVTHDEGCSEMRRYRLQILMMFKDLDGSYNSSSADDLSADNQKMSIKKENESDGLSLSVNSSAVMSFRSGGVVVSSLFPPTSTMSPPPLSIVVTTKEDA